MLADRRRIVAMGGASFLWSPDNPLLEQLTHAFHVLQRHSAITTTLGELLPLAFGSGALNS